MTVAIGKALAALQAVLFARELYGDGHAAVARPAAGAATLLAEALGGAESIEIMVIEHRIVCGGSVVAESPALVEKLIPRLHGAGVGSLTVSRGVAADDVVLIANQLTNPDGKHCDGSPHIRFGRIVVAGNIEQARGGEQPMDRAGQAVNSMLSDAAKGSTVDQKSLEGVIGAICAAVAVGRGAILPLAAVRNHDEYTYLHTVNVGLLAAALAEAVGLAPHIVQEITAAALLHDIGKQAVPLTILQKQGPLTPEERAVIMRHPVDGARQLLATPGVSNLARIVAYEHHMLLDGSGYPHRPRGRPIHLASRIVQLADVYDALRTHRPYRAALTPKQVEETLLKGSGTAYEPDLLQVFVKAMAERLPPPPTTIETPATPVAPPAALDGNSKAA